MICDSQVSRLCRIFRTNPTFWKKNRNAAFLIWKKDPHKVISASVKTQKYNRNSNLRHFLASAIELKWKLCPSSEPTIGYLVGKKGSNDSSFLSQFQKPNDHPRDKRRRDRKTEKPRPKPRPNFLPRFRSRDIWQPMHFGGEISKSLWQNENCFSSLIPFSACGSCELLLHTHTHTNISQVRESACKIESSACVARCAIIRNN